MHSINFLAASINTTLTAISINIYIIIFIITNSRAKLINNIEIIIHNMFLLTKFHYVCVHKHVCINLD